jgi:hypothetical protein
MIDYIAYFSILFAFHCLGDFPLQGEFLATQKSKSFYLLICHSAIYSLILSSGFIFLSHVTDYQLSIDTYTFFFITYIFIFFSHVVIDWLKCKANKISFAVDQLLHMLVIIFLI